MQLICSNYAYCASFAYSFHTRDSLRAHVCLTRFIWLRSKKEQGCLATSLVAESALLIMDY